MKSIGKPEIASPQTSLQRLHTTIEKAKPAFMALGRKYIDPERFARIIMAAARRPPKKPGQKTILDCTPESVVLACMEAASLGLEPDTPQAHCHLIPYGNVCTLQMGYAGLVALALRDPNIKHIEARLRNAGDVFKPQYAPKVNLEHIPNLDGEDAAPMGVYAIAHFSDGEIDFEYMRISEVNSIRDRRSKGAEYDSSPWKTDEGEMQKKTVLKRACKRWGRSKELSWAMAIDNAEGPHEPDAEVADMLAEIAPAPRMVSLPPAPPPRPPKSEPQPEPEQAPEPADEPSGCDGQHIEPPCADPRCYLTGDAEPVPAQAPAPDPQAAPQTTPPARRR
jgi:recombination protein RecT